jgi:Zn-dependent peptidase ImmA (M78 family)
MKQAKTVVNPEILRWARIKSGYSLEQVASRMKKSAALIRSWEDGDSSPTYLQLEALAYRIYKRPVAIFFFPQPPEEMDLVQSFRTLPQTEKDKFTTDTLLALREAQAMQWTLKEINEGVNPSREKIFLDLRAGTDVDLQRWTGEARRYLAVDLAVQKSWPDTREAFEHYRETLEEKGTFVFKRPFKQKDIFGFSLGDPEFPLIYINSSVAYSRQIFSLFHELAHILLGGNGVTERDDNYIEALAEPHREIEMLCNRFAAEFLVPKADFAPKLKGLVVDDDSIESLAREYNVSREVILRKLLAAHLIEKSDYEQKVHQWAEEFQRIKGKGGGDFYTKAGSYLGKKFIKLAFVRYYQGRCSREQLADYLNIKAKNLSGLEHFIFKKAS